jgi:predicted dinucleotide-utilizing enzyme
LVGFAWNPDLFAAQLTSFPGADRARNESGLGAGVKSQPEFQQCSPALIVEMFHPAISRKYGEHILGATDYLMLSVTAMADAELRQRLMKAAERYQHGLFIPHAACGSG